MSKKLIVAVCLGAAVLLISACGGNPSSEQKKNSKQPAAKSGTQSYDPNRGEGKYNENNVVAEALNIAMAEKGKAISGTKCTSCHKMSDERLVGPGWKGVTERRTLHWLMNFITNPDPMINKDPALQAQLEICLVRMPNQNLSDEEARSIVEYMRQNDEAK